MAPSQLTLEITETTLMSDPEGGLDVMRQLAARQIAISIDDYGTGYSSLAYLNDLPAKELKLDRSFTARVLHDQRTASIIAGTIDLAHGLGLRIVAEGVEDEATLVVLRKLGCDETQGYLHGKPMSRGLLRRLAPELLTLTHGLGGHPGRDVVPPLPRRRLVWSGAVRAAGQPPPRLRARRVAAGHLARQRARRLPDDRAGTSSARS